VGTQNKKKQKKQGNKVYRDDSTKEFTTQPTLHTPTYLFMLKICRVGLYTELFYAIINTLFPCFFMFFFVDVVVALLSLHFVKYLSFPHSTLTVKVVKSYVPRLLLH